MILKRTILQSTTLEPDILIDRITALLKDADYGILHISEKSVIFDSVGSKKFRSNLDYTRRFDSGRFDIDVGENHNGVRFQYCLIPSTDIFIVIIIAFIILTVAFFEKSLVALILSVIFPGQQVYKYFNLNEIAKEMLNKIVK